jgi:transcriptional regulator GlxA family with amidase domain
MPHANGHTDYVDGVFVTPHVTKMLDLFDPVPGEAIGQDRLADAELEADGSSAGVTKGIDRALALIEEGAGRQVAMNVARMLVVCLNRSAGQSQYCTLLAAQAQPKSVTFDSLDRWIGEHLKDDLRVEALAERVHMSPRNFARAYAKKRGRTPAKAVEAIRVDAARRLLEETEDRIDSIAEDSGFSSEEQMRCAFIRILGIPPREYRKRFLS